MLGGVLTWKLRAEDLVRDSGLPYTIIRPVALTEEEGGAPIVFDQVGDQTKQMRFSLAFDSASTRGLY